MSRRIFPETDDIYLRDDGIIVIKRALIGNVSGGNYLEVEEDGTLKFNGESTVWDDSMVPAFSARTAAANLALQSFSGGIYAPRYDLNDEIHCGIQFNHKIKTYGTVVVRPHIHLINKVAIGDANYNVKFEFEYVWGNINSTALDTSVNDPMTFSFLNASAYTHKIFSFSDITASANQGGISSLFFCRLKRVTASSNAYDTNDIFFGGFDVHFEIDTVGSRNYSSK